MRAFGPTRVARRQGFRHAVVVVPLAALAVLLLPSVSGAITLLGCALLAWLTSRPFVRPVSVSSELVVRGHERLGKGRAIRAARAGIRVTLGLHESIFVPIVFPESGRSLSLWALASTSEREAEAWIRELFRGHDVVLDEGLHG